MIVAMTGNRISRRRDAQIHHCTELAQRAFAESRSAKDTAIAATDFAERLGKEMVSVNTLMVMAIAGSWRQRRRARKEMRAQLKDMIAAVQAEWDKEKS